MALYRNVSISFWTDSKVDDDFTPEDKYFFLYLLTNPHTNLSGCYEISIKQMSKETGYNEDTIIRLIERMEKVHNVIRYDRDTKEVLIVNWSKFNWSSSEKLSKAVAKFAARIKSKPLRKYVEQLNNKSIKNAALQNTEIAIAIETDTAIEIDTDTETVSDTDTVVSIGYEKGINTLSDKKKEKAPTGLDREILNYTDNKYLITVIKDYIKFRKAIKSPLTDKALQLCLNKLDKLADTDDKKIAIVEQSIEKGWKGVYPLKDEPKQEEKADTSKYDFVINNF